MKKFVKQKNPFSMMHSSMDTYYDINWVLYIRNKSFYKHIKYV